MITTPREDRDAFMVSVFTDFHRFLRAVWNDRGLDKVAPLSDVELELADFISGFDREAAEQAADGLTARDLLEVVGGTTDILTALPRRRIALALRGFGKTTIIAALVCYRLGRDPNRKILIVSKNVGEAKKTIKLIKGWLEDIWFLRHLCPVKRLGDRDASTYLDVRGAKKQRQPSVSCVGIEGQLEGNRAHTLIPDDIETKGNTKTFDARQELSRLVGEFKNILYPHRPYSQGGPIDPVEIVFIGTPKHEESVYFQRHRAGYILRSWPIAFPTPDQKVINLSPLLTELLSRGQAKPGDPTLPHRFNREEIRERQSEGALEYAMESMLQSDLAVSMRYPLKLADLMVMDVPRDSAPLEVVYGTRDHNGSTVIEDLPSIGFGSDVLHRPAMISKDHAPYLGTRMRIDPSGDGADFTGVAVASYLAGTLWVKAVEGLPGGYSEPALHAIARMARDLRVDTIGVEDNFGRGMFQTIFRPVLESYFLRPGQHPEFPQGWVCKIEDKNAVGQKELRIIQTIGPALGRHAIVIDKAAIAVRNGQPGRWDPPVASMTSYTTRDATLDNELQYQITRITKDRKALPEDGKIDALEGVIKDWQEALNIDPRLAAQQTRQQWREDIEEAEMIEMGIIDGPRDTRWFRHR